MTFDEEKFQLEIDNILEKENDNSDYEDLAHCFGFETYQDMCEVMYKIKF